MSVIQNTWVEKEKKKKGAETALTLETNTLDSWLPINNIKKPVKRHSNTSRSTMVRTLRGVRK